MRMQISHAGGLELILPRGYDLNDAEKFILKKSHWIEKHLKSKTSTDQTYLLFGNKINVTQEFELFIKKHKIHFEKNELRIVSPANNHADIKRLYDIWLKHQAKIYLIERAIDLAKNYNFRVHKISIRSQKTRWGSCSTHGSLSFNFKLIQYRKEVIDYVIIHELCHLKEMNHSKKFWLLVEKLCPDFKSLRKELKGTGEI